MSIEKYGKLEGAQPPEPGTLTPEALVEGCEISELEAEAIAGGAGDSNTGCKMNGYGCPSASV